MFRCRLNADGRELLGVERGGVVGIPLSGWKGREAVPEDEVGDDWRVTCYVVHEPLGMTIRSGNCIVEGPRNRWEVPLLGIVVHAKDDGEALRLEGVPTPDGREICWHVQKCRDELLRRLCRRFGPDFYGSLDDDVRWGKQLRVAESLGKEVPPGVEGYSWLEIEYGVCVRRRFGDEKTEEEDDDESWAYGGMLAGITVEQVEKWIQHSTWGCVGWPTTPGLPSSGRVKYGGCVEEGGQLYVYLNGKWRHVVCRGLVGDKIVDVSWRHGWDKEEEDFMKASWVAALDPAICVELPKPKQIEYGRIVFDYGGGGHFSFSGIRITKDEPTPFNPMADVASPPVMFAMGHDECSKQICHYSWRSRDVMPILEREM